MNISFLNYHHWATIRLMDHLGTLPESILHKEIQSVFPSVMATLQHMYGADVIWLQRMKKDFQQPPVFRSIVEAKGAFLELQRQYENVIEGTDTHETIQYANSTGAQFTNSLEEIVIHVVNHGTYHRGNISAMLRQLGTKSVSTDYILYLREGMQQH